MKSVIITSFLASLALASPVELSTRQAADTGSTANDLLNDRTCRPYYLIIARASGEVDNIGSTVGPALCSGLQRAFGPSKLGCQGIGIAQGYSANLADNIPTYDGGILTSQSAVSGATGIFNRANTKCPNSVIVATGYSQGTAVLYNSIEKLSTKVKNQIAGVTLYGYTGNSPNKGAIPNYPTSKTKVFCNNGADGVCGASEIDVNASHLNYASSYAPGVSFLQSRINSA